MVEAVLDHRMKDSSTGGRSSGDAGPVGGPEMDMLNGV